MFRIFNTVGEYLRKLGNSVYLRYIRLYNQAKLNR